MITLCAFVTAPDRSTVPIRVWATDGVLVSSKLSCHCSNGGGSADAGAVPAGDAGVHVWTVRLPTGIYGVSTAYTLSSHGNPYVTSVSSAEIWLAL